MLNLEEGAVIVRIARSAVEKHLLGKTLNMSRFSNRVSSQRLGVFVSLLYAQSGALRGCIGSPFPQRPLTGEVAHVAVEAATMDPRFNPIELDELNHRIILEVTVLTPPEEINVENPVEYGEKVLVGRDGLIVDGFGTTGLLLPQVGIDEGFDSEEFLSQCCLKAGLLPDAWLSGQVRIWRFRGQIFSEDGPRGPVFERHIQPRT